MDMRLFFEMPVAVAHKQYEALRMYYIEGAPAHQVAQRYGYTYRALIAPAIINSIDAITTVFKLPVFIIMRN